MERFNPIGAVALKSPCTKDCPRRRGGCHAECPAWLEYEAYKRQEYEKRVRQNVASQASVDAERRIRRDARAARAGKKHLR